MSLTVEFGNFISSLKIQDVPDGALKFARLGFVDCFGVLVAGSKDPLIALMDRELASADKPWSASLVPSGELRNVEDAALLNGVAAHILDYDDVTSDGHPSAVLVPAILAQAEECGATGEEMLTAYAAGYEVWAELFAREPAPLHGKGWHPTAVRGTVGAAAACSRLLNLDSEKTSMALALSASLAAGLGANFGTMTKSFHVGRSAQSGVIAARLARCGVTAAIDALEHPSGYLAAFSPDGNAERERPFVRERREWLLERDGLNIKRYPTCYATHRAIDGMLKLVKESDVRPENIGRISVSLGKLQMRMLRNERPKTGLEAKFSIQFAMAAAIVARDIGLAQLTDKFVCDDRVQSLLPLVSCEVTSEIVEGTAFAPADAVTVTTCDGAILESGPIAHARGSVQLPLSEQELWQKFSDCVADQLDEPARERVFDGLMSLESARSAADILPSGRG